MKQLGALIITVTLASGCRGSDDLAGSGSSAPRLQPSTRLQFEPTFVGGHRSHAVTVHNPSRSKVELRVLSEAPFEAPTTLDLAGGEERELTITFTPTSVTESHSSVTIGAASLSVSGRGLEPPDCAKSTACTSYRFDAQAGHCVADLAPDGAGCSEACLVNARCEQGQCVGTPNTCDDGDDCTLDSCGEQGCQHASTLATCPLPDSPCETPVCLAGVGCATAPLPDGSPCGAQNCDAARVCINAQCVTRRAPSNQPCIEVMAGVPAGCGLLDGHQEEARLDLDGTAWLSSIGHSTGMAFDRDGNLYFSQGFAIRRLSPRGDVRTIAGDPNEKGHRDAFGAFARFDHQVIIGVDPAGYVVILEADPARVVPVSPSHPQTFALRKMSPTGVVTTWVESTIADPATADWRNWRPPLITLTPDGAVTLWGAAGSALVRVTPAGRLTRQKPEIDEADLVRGFYKLTSGPLGVWACGTYQTFRILDSGRFEVIGDGCLEQVRNLGVVRHQGYHVSQAELYRQLPGGEFDSAPLIPKPLREFAVDPSGRPVAYDPTTCQLRRADSGELLAGPVEHTGLIDGLSSRFTRSPAAMSPRGSNVLVADGETIREWSIMRGLETLFTNHGPVTAFAPSPTTNELLLYGSTLAVLDLSTRDSTPLEIPWSFYTVPPLYWASNGDLMAGGWRRHASDGPWEPFLYRTKKFSHSRFAEGISSTGFSIARFELDGGVDHLASVHANQRVLDLAEELNGDVVFIDDSTIVRRVHLSDEPRLETVIDLHVRPSAITVTPDGRIWLGVPHALLRLRLPD